MSRLTKIGTIEVDLKEVRSAMQNIISLTDNKCIINFRGRISERTGKIEPRAPLVLDVPIQEVLDLMNKL